MVDPEYRDLATRFDLSPYAQLLGMRIVELSQGYAKISLNLTDDYDNWEHITHGGLIMSLADQAFGCALNTLGRIYVALQFNMQFLSAAPKGECLFAEGRIVQAGKRAGAGEMVVLSADGNLIAKATGTVIALGIRESAELPAADP